ncbi:MAG: DMT family transporter [Gammaproteobacteria bacterium]|nr:DMT family transporter [Gammaproteobacteria bacterium]
MLAIIEITRATRRALACAGAPRANPWRPVVLMVCAVMCFPLMQTCVKLLVGDHAMHFLQVTWGRYFFHLLLVPLFFPSSLRLLGHTRRPLIQLTRGLMLFIGTAAAFLAVKYMAIPEMTAISFVAPIVVTLLAAVFLRERVSWQRWLAVVAGFIGVLIIVQPQRDLGWPVVLPLVMACCYAVYQVLTRVMRNDATAGVSLFYTALIGAVLGSIIAPFVWQWPDGVQWALLVGAAFFGALGHFLMIQAYELGEASFIAPFAYAELLAASFAGLLFFGDLIGPNTALGALVIAGAGWYVARSART